MTLAGVVLCCLLLGAADGVRLPGAKDESDLDYSDFPPLPPGMDPQMFPWYRSVDQEDGSEVGPGSQHVVSVLCLSVCRSLSHSVCLEFVILTKRIFQSLFVFLSLCLSLSLSLFVSLARSLSVCFCLSLSVCLSASLSLSKIPTLHNLFHILCPLGFFVSVFLRHYYCTVNMTSSSVM